MDFRTPEGQQRYDAMVVAASTAVIGLDFDGVLSPIVDDPDAAAIHPDGPRVLADLAAAVRAVAVITGRPARQVVDLGRLDEVADTLADTLAETNLFVLGQYGHERWCAKTREFESPPPPEGLARFMDVLPDLLVRSDAGGAFVEHKGIAVAVHTRRLPDSRAAYDRLLPVLSNFAREQGLDVEPGRQVIEVRGAGMHKGDAIRAIRSETHAEAVLFAGDDLGDIEAFKAVAAIREGGAPGLLVCSGSAEQQALVELSDIVVEGPEGVLSLLARFAADARTHAG